MIQFYSGTKDKVVNNSFQAKIHKHFNEDFTFTPLKVLSFKEPEYETLQQKVYNNCYYYTVNQDNIYDYLSQYSFEQLGFFIDDQNKTFTPYLETLLKYNHITKTEYNKTSDQYDYLVFIEGIAFPKSTIINLINSQVNKDTQEDKKRNLLKKYKGERKTVNISREYLREITGYTFNPILEDGRKVFIPWQKELLEDQSKYIFVVGSRQIGKTRTLAELAVENSFLPNQKILVCSFTNENTTIMRDYIIDFFGNFEEKVDYIHNKREGYIENLRSRSRIYFRSLSEEAKRIRGRKFNLIIIDEAAFVDNNTYERVLKPTITTTNGRIIAISTPDKRNWFYEEVLQAKKGKKNSSVYTVTIESNPFIDDALREEIMGKKDNPIIRNERFGEFFGSGNALFIPKLSNFYPVTSHFGRYVLSYDPARKKDRAGYTLTYIRNGVVYTILSGFIPDKDEFGNDIKKDWDKQAEFLKKLWLQNPKTLFGLDVTGVGDGVISILKSHGLKIDFAIQYTSGSGISIDESRLYGSSVHVKVGKSVLVNNLLDFIENGVVEFYEYTNKDLIEEVSYAEYTTTKLGQPAFKSDFFDDILNALMVNLFIINQKSLLSIMEKYQKPYEAYDEFNPAHRDETLTSW